MAFYLLIKSLLVAIFVSVLVVSTSARPSKKPWNGTHPTTAVQTKTATALSTRSSIPSSAAPSIKPTVKRSSAKSSTDKLLLLVGAPTISKKVKLYARSGYHLIMMPDGKLKGSFNSKLVQKYGYFEFQSYGKSLIRMKNLATKRFVGINSKGKVFSTTSPTDETLWREYQAHNYFHSFTSFKYHGVGKNYNWFLAIKPSNGQVRRASRVQQKHRSHQFLVLQSK